MLYLNTYQMLLIITSVQMIVIKLSYVGMKMQMILKLKRSCFIWVVMNDIGRRCYHFILYRSCFPDHTTHFRK